MRRENPIKTIDMKKGILIFAVAVLALCSTFVSCEKDESGSNNDVENNEGGSQNDDGFVGVYDFDMVYDSVTTSDGTWFSEEFYESMTHKVNPPEHGYLTIENGQNGKLNVVATIVKDGTQQEKVFFSTTATEKDGILILDDCVSDYYYETTEEMINFVFRNFSSNMPVIYFKSVYTINLGSDYSYLTSYSCTKRN